MLGVSDSRDGVQVLLRLDVESAGGLEGERAKPGQVGSVVLPVLLYLGPASQSRGSAGHAMSAVWGSAVVLRAGVSDHHVGVDE